MRCVKKIDKRRVKLDANDMNELPYCGSGGANLPRIKENHRNAARTRISDRPGVGLSVPAGFRMREMQHIESTIYLSEPVAELALEIQRLAIGE